MDISFFVMAFTAIFSIVNPLNVVPSFITLSANKSNEWQIRMSYKASINVCLILLVFAFFGNSIMNFFNITVHGMRIAGGIMICLNGFNMLKTKSSDDSSQDVNTEDNEKTDISFTPLAMPMLSGPGSISLVIGLFSRTTNISQIISLVAAIACTAFATFLVLRSSKYYAKLLGASGITAMTKITGFLILSIGVEFIINGIRGEFNILN
jgi:multiple antibiotic resistance protein